MKVVAALLPLLLLAYSALASPLPNDRDTSDSASYSEDGALYSNYGSNAYQKSAVEDEQSSDSYYDSIAYEAAPQSYQKYSQEEKRNAAAINEEKTINDLESALKDGQENYAIDSEESKVSEEVELNNEEKTGQEGALNNDVEHNLNGEEELENAVKEGQEEINLNKEGDETYAEDELESAPKSGEENEQNYSEKIQQNVNNVENIAKVGLEDDTSFVNQQEDSRSMKPLARFWRAADYYANAPGSQHRTRQRQQNARPTPKKPQTTKELYVVPPPPPRHTWHKYTS